MLEPMHKRSHPVADSIFIVLAVVVIVVGVWMFTRLAPTLNPDERDCLSQLQAQSRRDTNFTADEVVAYGRCLADRRE